MDKYSNKDGITLIALVVTIVVLLILAGVSIATLVGDNGIIKTAQEANMKSEIASVIEGTKLEASNFYMTKEDFEDDFINYLIQKSFISDEEYGKDYYEEWDYSSSNFGNSTLYVLNASKLLDEKLKLGNGTINKGDIYTIRFKDKGEDKEYSVGYYDKKNELYLEEIVYIKKIGNNDIPLPDDFFIYEDAEKTIIIEINSKYTKYGSSFGCGGSYTLIYNSDGTERTRFSVPEGVIGIRRYAFEYLENVAEISLPSTLKYIERGVFERLS